MPRPPALRLKLRPGPPRGRDLARPAPNRDGRPRSGAVVLARFGAAHGVKGELRLQSFTERPMSVLDYGPLDGSDGREYRIVAARPTGSADMLVVCVEGIGDRTDAKTLTGVTLSVPRSRLPEPEPDDFYHADLIGLAAETAAGEPLGTVTAVLNHGAGDILEIEAPGEPSLLVPFTRAAVPVVNVAAGRVVVHPPEEAPE